MPNPSVGRLLQGGTEAKALGEASPAEVCAEIVDSRPEGVHRYVERGRAAIVNKKLIKTEENRRFSTLIPYQIFAKKNRGTELIQYLYFFIYGYAKSFGGVSCHQVSAMRSA